MGRHWNPSPATLTKIRDDRRRGIDVKRIAREAGTTPPTIYHWLRRIGALGPPGSGHRTENENLPARVVVTHELEAARVALRREIALARAEARTVPPYKPAVVW